MMKKLFLLLFPALMLLGSCKPIDPVVKMNEYNNVVVYSHDLISNTGIATDYASITVKGDYSSGYYLLGLNDFKLAEGQPLRSSTVGNLIQYLADENDANGNEVKYNYAYFQTKGIASYTGDLQVIDLKFGWLSSVYWGSFVGDGYQYQVWFLPRRIQTYANKNTIVNVRGDSIVEKAIHPRFDIELDVESSTATFTASSITLPYSTSTGSQFNIREMVWPSLPIVYTPTGFTIAADSFRPRTAAGNDLYEITGLRCSFEADFDGVRSVEYTLTRLSDGEAVHVLSYFDYFLQQN
ncbi:MAG: hypothetical protein K2L05_01600 [Muribaculaceae bacterium]|nr:hypothetical protein [Muribaculaceae bacterium]